MKGRWLFRLIGVLILGIILWKLDRRDLLGLLSKAEPRVLLLALFLTVPFVLTKTWRWKYLLAMQGIDYDARSAFLAYMSGMYLGLASPGRIGDFAKVLYLKSDKSVPLGKGFSSVLVDRLFDVLILMSMALAGSVTLALSPSVLTIVLAFVVLFLVAVFVFLSERIGKRLIEALYRALLPKERAGGNESRFGAFYAGIGELKTRRLVVPLLLSLLSYLVFYLQCYLIASSLKIPIGIVSVAFCISTANLVSLLPVSISGVGTRDATLISLFSVLHLSKESALAFSIVFLFVSNMSAALIGAVAWLKKPISLKK